MQLNIMWLLPKHLCYYCSSIYHACGSPLYDCQVYRWVGVYFYCLVAYTVPSGTMNTQSVGVKILGKHQLNSPVFNEMYRWCLQQQSLTGRLWRATNSFGKQSELFGGLHGAPLVNNSVRCNLFLILRISLDGERYLAGALSLPLFGDSIQVSFIYVYIFKSFYCSRFPYDPSNGH